MQHARLGIAALLVTVVAASCGTGDEKSVGTPKSTATTSTSTSTGTGSCAAKCAGATPYCGDAGECVACRTNVDCGAGMVCHKDGATVA